MSGFPRPFDEDFLDNCLYDRDSVLLDELVSIDKEAHEIVCRMRTDKPGIPFLDGQRNLYGTHPRHISGGVLVHLSGMMGMVHAHYVEGMLTREGWVGYGTTIHKLEIWRLRPTNQGFLEAQNKRIWEPDTT